MTTLRVLPETLDYTGMVDVWEQLTEFLATVTTGDVVQNPHPDARFLCDRSIDIPHVGVRFEWEGATFQQGSLRPYGQSRTDCQVVDGKHLVIPSNSPLIPNTCNWGYVTGPGVPDGTQIVLDYSRRSGTLSNYCAIGAGLPLTFTAKDDRSRCGFNITGRDVELRNAKWRGAVANPTYTRYLEAQAGVNCSGATRIRLVNISSENMQGDHLYLGPAAGSQISTWVEAAGGSAMHNARSFVVPVNQADCSVSDMVIGNVGRTVVDIEPPNSDCTSDRFSMKRCLIGKHRLTLLSSGGDLGAHVGAVDFSENWLVNDDMSLWLVAGDARNLRGPYSIVANRTTYEMPFGGTYPNPALICIDHANSGSKVVDNKGIVLQARTPIMAVVRAQRSGTVEVHGNDHAGGIEVGAWL